MDSCFGYKIYVNFLRLKPYESDSDDEDYNVDFDDTKLPPIEVPPGDHKLQSSYNLWFVVRILFVKEHKVLMFGFFVGMPGKGATEHQNTESLSTSSVDVRPSSNGKLLSSQFQRHLKHVHFFFRWSLYCHLLRPTELKPYRKLHLFKSGIKPMWEDPENLRGGKWILRLRKNKVNRAWENVCMAMLGEQFLVGPEICGIVLSTQYPEDLLSVWNRTATDVGSTNRIRDVLKRILNLPANFPIEYKPHSDSLK